jgi:NADH:ubiquinone oxidoreductase subunit C
MYGIFFFNHPNLQKILTDYGFKGFPLRKDFPLTGFYEIIYKDIYKQLNYIPLELAQDYRYYTNNVNS